MTPAAELAFFTHGRGTGIGHTLNTVADRTVGASRGHAIIWLTLTVPAALTARARRPIGAGVDAATFIFVTNMARRAGITGVETQFDLFFAEFSRRHALVVGTRGSTVAVIADLTIWAELLTNGFLIDNAIAIIVLEITDLFVKTIATSARTKKLLFDEAITVVVIAVADLFLGKEEWDTDDFAIDALPVAFGTDARITCRADPRRHR